MLSLFSFILWISFISKATPLSILTIENHDFGVHSEGEDGWGEWNEWHACSRSCGGGVTYMQRECKRNRTSESGRSSCVGSARMYTSCSIQDCPVNSQDFRSFQCAQHNNSTYNGRRYEWIPYTGESAVNECELYCQPSDKSFFLRLANEVVDGTRCRTSDLDVCVDGACEAVGCDMIVGSELKTDVCGECDGDGTSCHLVKSAITGKLPSGYTPLLLIPPGATNVHVYEKKGTRNFLAVRDSNKQYVLNGNWQINGSTIVEVAGTHVMYNRKLDKKRSPEHITIKGPTMEMIYIDVLVQDRNRGIEYEFYIPRGMTDPNHGEHVWVIEAWNSCSRKCGGGLQKRRIICKTNGKRVLNYLCNAKQRPPLTGECNTHPCEASWLSGNWSACTVTCGGGIQTRTVNCIEASNVAKGAPFLLPDDRCLHLSEKPSQQQSCEREQCSEWTVSEWSTCSITCGNGIQTRLVTCPRQNTCSVTSLPISEKSCNLVPCTGIEWVLTDWSDCTSGCGEGMQTRHVNCAGKDKTVYPDVICDILRRPTTVQNCHSTRLCPPKPDWLTEEWSECSSHCGVGMKTRRVVCAVFSDENYRILPDEECFNNVTVTKPSTSHNCTAKNCTVDWYSGPWGPCSAICGDGGSRMRTVMCMTSDETEAGLSACDQNTRPIDTEECNRYPCTTEINPTPVSSTNCHRSPYGCCPDGISPASGPFQKSCGPPTCRNSLYGCCPDGRTYASGKNREGCRDEIGQSSRPVIVPVINQDRPLSSNEVTINIIPEETGLSNMCRHNADPGPCDGWVVHWFFNAQTGQCDRFWFGGCRGNDNRFETNEECARECGGPIRPASHGRNNEPIRNIQPSTTTSTPTTKPTIQTRTFTTTTSTIAYQEESRHPSYSSDFDIIPRIADTNTDVIHHVAPEVKRKDKSSLELPPPICFLRKSTGPCQARHRRWHFDGSSGTCLSFWYGGCGGNENNFASEKYCAQICGSQPIPMFDRGLEDQNTPPVAVTIKPGRSEVFAQVGKMVRLACMAEGSPTPIITWNRLEKQLDMADERYEILEDNSLIISKISPDDAGSYRCVASNGVSPDQKWTVKLIVKDRVLISETPTDMTIAEGLPAALRCRIQDDVLFVTWYKDGEKVLSDDYYNVQPWGDLHILDVEEEDSGKYTCTAYSSDASQSASAILTVTNNDKKSLPDIRRNLPSTATTTTISNTVRHSDEQNNVPAGECRDYPEYANCNVVVSRRMCHKHDYFRYCCASCGGLATQRYSARGRHTVRRHTKRNS